MKTTSIKEEIAAWRTLIEQRLDVLLPEQNCAYSNLFKAARYSLLAGGKRLRPLLTIATADMLGVPLEAALDTACAIEMVHTYSLIHDDLPCMDDDDMRRGRPTLHKVFPEAIAVMAGDHLLTYAFEVIASTLLPPAQKSALSAVVARGAGGHGMIGGQVLDIESVGKQLDIEQLQLIHCLKTGALITASIECGGIIAQADEKTLLLLRRFGLQMGLAFQIIDDVLDVVSLSEVTGKTASSDKANNKSTYVDLLGIDGAKSAAQALFSDAKQALALLGVDSTALLHLGEQIVHRVS